LILISISNIVFSGRSLVSDRISSESSAEIGAPQIERAQIYGLTGRVKESDDKRRF